MAVPPVTITPISVTLHVASAAGIAAALADLPNDSDGWDVNVIVAQPVSQMPMPAEKQPSRPARGI